MLDQCYVMEGRLTTIVAPTTCFFRRDAPPCQYDLRHLPPE
jgi:hypothetical protein